MQKLVLSIFTACIITAGGISASANSKTKNPARHWETNNGVALVQHLNPGHTITYQIMPTDKLYMKAYQDAINKWNSLGVIKLVPVTNNAQITLTGGYDQNINHVTVDGSTTFNEQEPIYQAKNFKYQYFTPIKIQINGHLIPNGDPQIEKYTSELKYTTITTEHELGHALGFDHDDTLNDIGNIYVMDSSYNYKDIPNVAPLGKYEKTTLEKYYGPQLH